MKTYCLAAAASVLGEMTTQDWLFLLSLAVSVLGMVQAYLKDREMKSKVVN